MSAAGHLWNQHVVQVIWMRVHVCMHACLHVIKHEFELQPRLCFTKQIQPLHLLPACSSGCSLSVPPRRRRAACRLLIVLLNKLCSCQTAALFVAAQIVALSLSVLVSITLTADRQSDQSQPGREPQIKSQFLNCSFVTEKNKKEKMRARPRRDTGSCHVSTLYPVFTSCLISSRGELPPPPQEWTPLNRPAVRCSRAGEHIGSGLEEAAERGCCGRTAGGR